MSISIFHDACGSPPAPPLLCPFWQVRKESVKKTVEALLSSLSDSDKADLLKAL